MDLAAVTNLGPGEKVPQRSIHDEAFLGDHRPGPLAEFLPKRFACLGRHGAQLPFVITPCEGVSKYASGPRNTARWVSSNICSTERPAFRKR